MHNSNVQTIKNRFEQYNEVAKNESSQPTNKLLGKYVLTRSATSMGPLKGFKRTGHEKTNDENVNLNNIKFNIQRSLTSLDMLNTSTINRNLNGAIEKVVPTKTVDTKDIKLTNKELKTNTNIYGMVGPLVENPHEPIARIPSDSNNISHCLEPPINGSTKNNINTTNKSSVILSRQLSDPLKKGNIKRTPAFRCERSFIKDSDQIKYNVKSNLSNRIKMFEENQSRNKTNQMSSLVLDESKPYSKYNNKLDTSENNSTKCISTNLSKKNSHKISSGTAVSLNSSIKVTPQNSEAKKNQSLKYKSINSENPVKSKSNHILKKELETITKQRLQSTSLSKEMTDLKISEQLQNINVKKFSINSNLDTFKSSSNLSLVPIKIIPEYAQVSKPKITVKKLKTFSKKTDYTIKTLRENVIMDKEKKSVGYDNLTDTLKKALKSPLPNGPPPKKPPRTFAHSSTSEKYISKSDVPYKLPTRENVSSLPILGDKESKRAKNDPKVMLEKLEYALLNNKIKSPKVDHKVLNISAPMNVTHTSFLNMPKTDLILIENKIDDEIKQNMIDDTSTYNVGQKTLLLDCFPIICKENNYMEIEGKPVKSKSEFFVNCQIIKPIIKSATHIYAEPFEFERKISSDQNLEKESNTYDVEYPSKESCSNIVKSILEKFEHNESKESIPKPDLHYLCTPIHNSRNTCEELNTLFNENISTLIDTIKSDEQKSDKNELFDNKIAKEKLHQIMSLAYNFTANSNFDIISLISANDTNNKITINTSKYFDKTANMSQKEKFSTHSFVHNPSSNTTQSNVLDDERITMDEPLVRTGSGRVKTLLQQFEVGVNKNNTSSKIEYSTLNMPTKMKRYNANQKINFNSNKAIFEHNNAPEEKYDLVKSKSVENSKVTPTQEDDLLKLLTKEIISEINSDSLENEESQTTDLDASRKKRHELSKSLSVKHKLYVKRVSSKVDKYKKMVVQTSCSPNLFDCCLLIGLNISNKTPYIKMKYPENYNLPSCVEIFCFPDASHWSWPHTTSSNSVSDMEKNQTYSLVLTDENGNRRFGFCRRVIPEGASLCLPLTYCILTPFRSIDFYSKVLKELESRHGLPDTIFMTFLRDLYETPFPRPGESVSLVCRVTEPVLVFSKDPNYEPIEIGRQIIDDLDNAKTQKDSISQEYLEKQNNRNQISNGDENNTVLTVFMNESPNYKSKSEKEIDFVFISHNDLNSNNQLNNSTTSSQIKSEHKEKSMFNFEKPVLNNTVYKNEFVLQNSSVVAKENNDIFKTISLTREFDSRTSEKDLTTLCNTLQLSTIIQIFGSLLLERKVVLVCKSISKLSMCIQALQSMLYPFSWQHTFVPILPSIMLDILNAPTPFVIGVLETDLEEDLQIEEGIAVNLDKDIILCSTGDELAILPDRIIRTLKIGLTSIRTKTSLEDSSKNVLISEAFVNIFVQMLGNYRQFIRVKNRTRHFEKEAFINSNSSKTIQLFLEWFTETSMFNAFIDSFLNSTDVCVNYDIFLQRVFEHKENINKKKTFTEKIKKWNLFS